MVEVLERVSEAFYNPWIFWVAPFVAVVARALVRRLRAVSRR
ncbi:MAG: hypothetical protein ACE5FS_08840 [Paracoccaceae bacterium]